MKTNGSSNVLKRHFRKKEPTNTLFDKQDILPSQLRPQRYFFGFLPNFISFLRLLSSFLIVYWIIEFKFLNAFFLFCIAAASDFLDGFLARFFKSNSYFGACLDPLADKILLDSTFIALTFCQLLPIWLVFLIVLRDLLLLTGVTLLWLSAKKFKLKPILVSKLNTAFQMLLVLAVLYPGTLNPFLIPLFIYVTAFLTLLSGISYVRMGMSLMRLES